MKRLALLIPLALAACSPGAGLPPIPPAPLEQTAADEKALTLAAKAVSTAAVSSSALVRVGVIEPGSPTALTIARALDDARRWVNVADAARKAGNARSYAEAIAGAEAALATINTALGG